MSREQHAYCEMAGKIADAVEAFQKETLIRVNSVSLDQTMGGAITMVSADMEGAVSMRTIRDSHPEAVEK